MAWHWAITAARHIPWRRVLAQAPQIAATAQQLYEASQQRAARREAPADLAGLQRELERLREDNAEQLRVIDALAHEVQGLAVTVAALRLRLWLLAGAAGLALLTAAAALWLAAV